ncbi:swi5-dependent recombination DNA repair protein 1 homolog isoform X2 [Danaus plexippus]|uniref:swi5-dependent recombination DNA repair protein 1 homolog isoform X2 n=1 Tax=Danaus plexippus TaxID=13037 RepID=UPI002AAFC4F4|nr:swi5-dependent recombination DNA repair protein 1 homolog isoform X2 [Danaus plexippus]
MQRKPGYPATANNMKMELGLGMEYVAQCDFASESQCDDDETQQRRQQLINFGHSQWGFNNWSWLVTSQALDFVENHNGIYTAGVACFVSVKVKSLDIQRVNVGYATSVAAYKGLSIHRARMCSVTNGLLETLLSFGGNLASELMELLESNKNEAANHIMVPEAVPESSSNPLIKTEPKNLSKPINRKDTEANVNLPQVFPQKGPKNTLNPPVAKAHPMPANLAINMSTNLPNPPTTPAANLPPAANAPRPPYAAPPAPAPAHVRPNSNDDSAEAARNERKRRQRLAKEEFLKKQMEKDADVFDVSPGDLIVAEVVNEEEHSGLLVKRKSPDSRGDEKRSKQI